MDKESKKNYERK